MRPQRDCGVKISIWCRPEETHIPRSFTQCFAPYTVGRNLSEPIVDIAVRIRARSPSAGLRAHK